MMNTMRNLHSLNLLSFPGQYETSRFLGFSVRLKVKQQFILQNHAD